MGHVEPRARNGWSARRGAVLGLSFAVMVGLCVPLFLDIRSAQNSEEHPPWLAIAGIFTVALLWVLLLAEALYYFLRRRGAGIGPIYSAKETSASLTVFAIQQLVGGLLLVAALAYLGFLYTVTPISLPSWIDGVLPAQPWGVIVSTLILFIGIDFLFYVYHRANHRVEILWANHSVHHSSEEMNISVTARNSPFDIAGEFVCYGVMALLGFNPIAIVLMRTFIFLFQVPIHTQLVGRGPRWYEFVFNSPSHHRVHHGSQAQYLDRNYGAALIIWDRLFGTFAAEADVPRYGLTHNIGTHNPLRIEVAEWPRLWRKLRASRTWPERVASVVKPPGWSPEPARDAS